MPTDGVRLTRQWCVLDVRTIREPPFCSTNSSYPGAFLRITALHYVTADLATLGAEQATSRRASEWLPRPHTPADALIVAGCIVL